MKCISPALKGWSLSFTTPEKSGSKLGYLAMNPWFLASCKSSLPSNGSCPNFGSTVKWPPVCSNPYTASSATGRTVAGTLAAQLFCRISSSGTPLLRPACLVSCMRTMKLLEKHQNPKQSFIWYRMIVPCLDSKWTTNWCYSKCKPWCTELMRRWIHIKFSTLLHID